MVARKEAENRRDELQPIVHQQPSAYERSQVDQLTAPNSFSRRENTLKEALSLQTKGNTHNIGSEFRLRNKSPCWQTSTLRTVHICTYVRITASRHVVLRYSLHSICTVCYVLLVSSLSVYVFTGTYICSDRSVRCSGPHPQYYGFLPLLPPKH